MLVNDSCLNILINTPLASFLSIHIPKILIIQLSKKYHFINFYK